MTDEAARLARANNALANRIELLAPFWAKIPDGTAVQKVAITVSPAERDRIVTALRAAIPPIGTLPAIDVDYVVRCLKYGADDELQEVRQQAARLIESPPALVAQREALERLDRLLDMAWNSDNQKIVIDILVQMKNIVRAALRANPPIGTQEPFGYALEQSGVNNGHYLVSVEHFAKVEDRFKHLYTPLYASPPALVAQREALEGKIREIITVWLSDYVSYLPPLTNVVSEIAALLATPATGGDTE